MLYRVVLVLLLAVPGLCDLKCMCGGSETYWKCSEECDENVYSCAVSISYILK